MMEERDLKIVIAHTEYEKGKKLLHKIDKNSSFFNKNWQIVASILIITSLTWLFYPSEIDSEKLFADNFEPYTNIIAPISRVDKDKTTTQVAFENYENKKYIEALKGFEKIKTKEESTAINLYIAVTNLALKNSDKAILILEKNLSNSKAWEDKYLWYLSLGYLKEKNIVKAIETLEKLSKKEDNFKKLETLSLLKKLK